jgi:hypothetical protein
MKTRYFLSTVILGVLAMAWAPASANVAGMAQSAITLTENTDLIQVQRRGAVRYNRGVNVNRNINVNRNVRVNRNVNVNRNVYRGGRGLYRGRYVYRGGPWVRPRNYWWPVGGAIAAGAALGMVTAASAAAWAGQPPGPGYSWYYTDPSRRQGFWDQCQ